MRLPVQFIDGNHHDYSITDGITQATALHDGLIFHPRGSVAEIDGRKVGFLGGAESVVGLEGRRGRFDYWPTREAVRNEDVVRLVRNAGGALDIIVTHSPPAEVLTAISHGCVTESSRLVQEAWESLGKPDLICGHIHEHYTLGSVEVLPYLGATIR
jgi:Icc-related predicted phosphoesterase